MNAKPSSSRRKWAVESMVKLTTGRSGAGTRFAARWKQSEQAVVECTQFDRPRSMTLVNGGSLAVDLHITVAPQGSGTLFPVFKLMMGSFEKANMGYLKKAIERRPAAAVQ